MSTQFIVRFHGQALWFEYTTFAQRNSTVRRVYAIATSDQPASIFTSEVEAWRTAEAHGLNLKLVTVVTL